MSYPKIVGRVEIAKLLQVETRTPHAWSARGLLPEPDYAAVNGGSAWNTTTIIEWALRTGRCPVALRAEYDPDELIVVPAHRGRKNVKADGNNG